MELVASQDPRSYSLYFDLNIWFRARKVTGTFEKRASAGPVATPTIAGAHVVTQRSIPHILRMKTEIWAISSPPIPLGMTHIR